VVTAAPDGYTLGTADNALVLNPAMLRDRLPYDTERDVGALGLAVTAPVLLLAHPGAPAHSVAEVVAEAAARPGLGMSHGGIGTPSQLAVVQFQLATGREIQPVGYRGGGPQLVGLVSGEVPYGFVALSSALQHVQSGRLRPLGLSGAARTPLLPDVPSLAEAGLPAVDVLGEWGFITPPGLPPQIVARLHALLLAPAREPALRAKLEAQGYAVVASTPEDHATRIRQQIAQWRAVVTKAGITAE
jgi:tripartite-type tricarboxylate transporter receptor subunit TctC